MNQTTDQSQSELDERRLLDDFLVDNQELENLDARLRRFNILDVLGVSRAELRHSNILAWLLDPAGSHGLGDSFLRRFLSRLVRDKQNLNVRLRPAGIELMPFGDIEVLREWHHVDVLVQSRSGQWALLIENKIGASESVGQLARYVDEVRKALEVKEVVPVFLTIEGEDPSEEGQRAGFVSLAWGEVLELLARLVAQYASKIPPEAKVLLDHYLDTLRKLTMQDPELIDLCKAIYRKHKAAINLILEHGASSQVLESCERAVQAFPKLAFPPLRSGGRIWFLPEEMKVPGLPACASWGPSGNEHPIMWWFHWIRKTGKFQLTLEVGPIVNQDERMRLLRAAQEGGFRSSKEFKQDGRYTRLLTETRTVQTNEDGDPNEDDGYIQELVATMWKSAWGKGNGIVEVLHKVAPTA